MMHPNPAISGSSRKPSDKPEFRMRASAVDGTGMSWTSDEDIKHRRTEDGLMREGDHVYFCIPFREPPVYSFLPRESVFSYSELVCLSLTSYRLCLN